MITIKNYKRLRKIKDDQKMLYEMAKKIRQISIPLPILIWDLADGMMNQRQHVGK